MTPIRFEKLMKDFEKLDELTRLSRIYGGVYDNQLTFKQFKIMLSVHHYLCDKEDNEQIPSTSN